MGESSASIRERVERARAVQRQRFAGTHLFTNADMGPKAEALQYWQRRQVLAASTDELEM